MRFSLIPTAIATCLAACGTCAFSQDASNIEETGRAALNDPRFKNAFRSVKSDPEKAIDSLSEEHSDTVRAAEDKLLKELGKLQNDDSPAIATTRKKLENMAQQAAPSLAKLLPTPAAAEGEAPATRAAVTATPIAMPVPPTESGPGVGQPVPETVVQQTSVKLADEEATIRQIPDSPALNPDQIPAPKPLEKKYDTDKTSGNLRPKKKAKSSQMEIYAKEAIMDNTTGTLVFTGNVVVDHPQYDMKCEKLVVTMAEGSMMNTGGDGAVGGTSNFKRAVASGGTVEIRSVNEKGEPRLALAREADYDAINNVITLSGGPPYMQDGGSFIETYAEDAQIIMRVGGKAEVKGSQQSHISIPIPQDGKGKKGFDLDALSGVSERIKQ